MVDRNLVREILGGIQARLLHERLAQAMSRAVAEREFAFELASLIEEHVRDVAAIPPWTVASPGEADLLVLPRRSVAHRRDGTLAPPTAWPPGTVAVEIAEVRLANGVDGPAGYDGVLSQLSADLARKAAARSDDASWLGLTVMTDAAWADTLARPEGRRVAREVRVDRWRPCPEGLLCIGSVVGSMAYRAWRGDVWVEAFVAQRSPTGAGSPPAQLLRVRPPSSFGAGDRETLSWYACHGADGATVDAAGWARAHLRVEADALHEHRRDQYERLGAWGGSFDELRLCLFAEARLWSGTDERGPFDEVPGVKELLRELRVAWDAVET